MKTMKDIREVKNTRSFVNKHSGALELIGLIVIIVVAVMSVYLIG